MEEIENMEYQRLIYIENELCVQFPDGAYCTFTEWKEAIEKEDKERNAKYAN